MTCCGAILAILVISGNIDRGGEFGFKFKFNPGGYTGCEKPKLVVMGTYGVPRDILVAVAVRVTGGGVSGVNDESGNTAAGP